jgi:hypothetical protein
MWTVIEVGDDPSWLSDDKPIHDASTGFCRLLPAVCRDGVRAGRMNDGDVDLISGLFIDDSAQSRLLYIRRSRRSMEGAAWPQ